MRYLDARRLTGPNLLAKTPLVVVEVALADAEDRDAVHASYRRELDRLAQSLGVAAPSPLAIVRPHRGGATFAFEAPFDEMLAYAELAELAAIAASEAPDPIAEVEGLLRARTLFEEGRNLAVRELLAEGARHGIPVLADDDGVSIGLGKHSVYYPNKELPDAASIPWKQYATPLPIAFVSGTNGKTTSSRLLAFIAENAGFHVGATSTDGLVIQGVVVERGDWTGPVAARAVLRNPAVDFAVLETARGGILRRGLAIDRCDVALLTNISGDHLGDYGIDDVAQMAEAKAVIAKGASHIVLNAADRELVAISTRFPTEKLVFFADFDAVDPERQTRAVHTLASHRAAGGRFAFARAGQIFTSAQSEEEPLLAVADAPITFDGAARYNVENVLGVVAAAQALGLPDATIVDAVKRFGAAENPGRGTLVTHPRRDPSERSEGDGRANTQGVRIFIDFGHNPDGVQALIPLVRALRKEGGLSVVAGMAGDRSDQDVADVVAAVGAMKPDRVFVRELGGYLRGRELGELPALFTREFARFGLEAPLYDSEVSALRAAIAASAPGDLVVLLVHVEHDAVAAFLQET